MLQHENIILSERSQTQKATHCMIPFIWNKQNPTLYIDRKHSSGCHGLAGVENGEWLLHGHRISFWGDENILDVAFWMH
jgi:hypothetical protein